jgi:hypothetical protein
VVDRIVNSLAGRLLLALRMFALRVTCQIAAPAHACYSKELNWQALAAIVLLPSNNIYIYIYIYM